MWIIDQRNNDRMPSFIYYYNVLQLRITFKLSCNQGESVTLSSKQYLEHLLGLINLI